MMDVSHHPNDGFTLIELLVVVSILAILAGLLLPAIKLVKSAAESSNCLNNQRQIALAIGSYANDEDGWLPTGRRSPTNVNNYASFDTLLATYDGREITNIYSLPSNPNPKTLKAWGMYRCPSEKDVLSDAQWLAQNGTNFYRSYAMNGAMVSSNLKGIYDPAGWNAGESSTCCAIAQISKPARTILLAEIRYLQARMGGSLGEAVTCPSGQIAASSGYYIGTTPLHRKKWNYLFVDGHSETLLSTDTNSPGISQNTTDVNGMWWK